MSLMFDSLAYAKRLKAAGVPDAQAEIQAEIIVEWMEDRLATKLELEHVRADLKRDIESVRADLKRDIESVRAELKRDIESVRADLKRDIKELEQRMVIKLGSLMFVAVGAMAALVKLL
ncbi:MAG: CCDC90 family protein [Magnetococcus sp. THC-1_WYH]